jgi:hypothetical protein
VGNHFDNSKHFEVTQNGLQEDSLLFFGKAKALVLQPNQRQSRWRKPGFGNEATNDASVLSEATKPLL